MGHVYLSYFTLMFSGSAKRGLGSEGVVKMQIGGIDGHVKQ
jgi:hypothetical protein